MAASGCPILRADAVTTVLENELQVELEDLVANVSGAPPSDLFRAVSLMNGLVSVESIRRESALSSQHISALIGQLANVGALTFSNDSTHAPIDPASFAAICRRLYGYWKQRLFSHPLWVGLANGTLPRCVFVGWAIESWWFIEGVLDRLPMAIASTESRAMRAIYSRHFSEEWDHFRFFEQSLDSLKITADIRAKIRPLPSTVAVQNWMRASARRDPIRYATCSGFLESTGADRAAARKFFDAVGEFYDGDDLQAVRPMAAHVALDEEYGHEGVVEKILQEILSLDRERARAALQDAYGFLETLEMWSTDILRYYHSVHAFPLRSLRIYSRGRDDASF